ACLRWVQNIRGASESKARGTQVDQGFGVATINGQHQIPVPERKRLHRTGNACHCCCSRQSRRHNGPFKHSDSHIDTLLMIVKINARLSRPCHGQCLPGHPLSSLSIRECVLSQGCTLSLSKDVPVTVTSSACSRPVNIFDSPQPATVARL